MKTDKQLKQILVDNLCPSPTAWVAIPDSTDIEPLSIEELERLIAIATSQTYWLFNTPTKEFVEWVMQTLQTKQFGEQEQALTVDQLDLIGMPTGITNLWGNDVVLGDDVY
jgi:hypothetical protein